MDKLPLNCHFDNEDEFNIRLKRSLEHFTLMRLRFTLSAISDVYLGVDEKKGDRWRSGFKDALRQLDCFRKDGGIGCKQCALTDHCDYFLFCENDKPRSYVFHPALDSQSVYKPGAPIYLDIVLVGRAIQKAARFIHAITQLGRIGIGGRRATDEMNGKYFVNEVAADTLGVDDFFDLESKPDKWQIEILTPLKIKDEHNGLYYDSKDITFHVLFKFLVNRIFNLNYLHCNGTSCDKNDMITANLDDAKQHCLRLAETMRSESRTGWRDYRRHSSRQRETLKIGGQLGVIEVEGDLHPLYPYLKIGELTGVGSNTVSGFGRYKLKV